jgi:preprotein translocase subunit SecA
MFGLFKSKPSKKKIDYLVYRTEVAKYKMMVDDIRKKFTSSKDIIVVCFFKDTYQQLQKLFEVSRVNQGDHDTRFSLLMHDEGKWKTFGMDYTMILGDIHPMASVMQEVADSHNGEGPLTCYLSFDNAFFNLFGGERLVTLLDRLGLEEYEHISHTMVDKSIESAQKKIEEKVEFQKPASSIDEWMQLNVKK